MVILASNGRHLLCNINGFALQPNIISMNKQTIQPLKSIGVALILFITIPSFAQKVINNQNQSWGSFIATAKVYKNFSVGAEVHIRRNNFYGDRSFEFVRGTIIYNVDDRLSFGAGYGHMWVAAGDNSTTKEENRIFEQVQYTSKFGRITLVQKARNEQRWINLYSGKNTFSDRVRLLNTLTIPVFKNKYLPALALADEVCVQFGTDIVSNTFDQHRWFIGIRQMVSKTLSFDTGYMEVLQQRTATNYDNNHTFRFFLYYTPDFRKKK